MKYIILSRPFYLVEAHSFCRKDALNFIKGLKKTLRRHLVKLITRPEYTTDTTHWIIEIQSYLDDMCDFSLKQGSSLTPKVIYEALVGQGKVDMEQSVKNIIKKMLAQDYTINPEYLKKKNLSEEADKILKFYQLASQAISDHFSKNTEINAKQLLEKSGIV